MGIIQLCTLILWELRRMEAQKTGDENVSLCILFLFFLFFFSVD